MIDFNFVLQLAGRNTDINEYLLSLYNIPVQMNAKMIVELGAGQSTYALTASANETKGQFYSIDVTEGAIARGYSLENNPLKDEERYHFILGDDMEVVKTWDKEIDFLFLDTSHLLEHTRAELKAWLPLVREGGVIMMHDTAHKTGDGMGCRQALNEFLEENDNYFPLHLLDTKYIGMSILCKLQL